jgi:hypothetical protein
VTHESFALETELLDWLQHRDHPVAGWADPLPYEQMHCHPDLADKLETHARQVGGIARVWVAGCPVFQVGPAPVAYARGTNICGIRSGEPAGPLASDNAASGLDFPWVHLDPFAPDVTFTTTKQLLLMHLQRARNRAEAGVWP